MSSRDTFRSALFPIILASIVCTAGFYYVVYDYLRLGVKLGHLLSVMIGVSISMQAMLIGLANSNRTVKLALGLLLSIGMPFIALTYPLLNASPLPAWEVLLFIACLGLPGALGTVVFVMAPPDDYSPPEWIWVLMGPVMLVYLGSPVVILVLGAFGVIPLSQDFWPGHTEPIDLALGYGVTAVFSVFMMVFGIGVGCLPFIPLYFYAKSHRGLTLGAGVVGPLIVGILLSAVWGGVMWWLYP